MAFTIIDQRYDPAVEVGSLHEHPDNPRQGNDEAVAASVEATGFFGAVLVQASTGYVIAGNTRLRVAQAQGAATVPAFMLDVDDATAKRILLADNRLGDLATYDEAALLALLQEMGDLTGTGYDEADLDDLLATLQETGHDHAEQVEVGHTDGEHPYRQPDEDESTLVHPGFDERLDKYRTKTVRSLILDYPLDTYEGLASNLAALRERLDAPTNADVVLHLVQQATG
jgi:hypothetical protein